MKKYHTLFPIQFPEQNRIIGPRPLSEDELKVSASDKMLSLPVYFDGTQMISIWKCGIWARIQFLFSGEINCIELGNKPSAKALTIGPAFRGDS